MRNTSKITPTIIIGSIIVVLTLLGFFLTTLFSRDSLDWLALIFVITSELVLFGFLNYLFSTPANSGLRIFQTSIVSVLGLYWIISVLLAIFRYEFGGNIIFFTLANILLIGVVAIVYVLLNSAASRFPLIDSKTSNSMTFMQGIEQKILSLSTDSAYTQYKPELYSIYEKVRFSDKVGSSSYDLKMSEEIENLEISLKSNSEDTRMHVEKSISQILFYIAQRNNELIQGKRGGF